MKNKEIGEDNTEHTPSRLERIPLWGWILIFVLPLVSSEYMFYAAKRLFSLVAFPIAWIVFWILIMNRSGWSLFRKGKRGQRER
jgi:hypothetical protein